MREVQVWSRKLAMCLFILGFDDRPYQKTRNGCVGGHRAASFSANNL